MFYVAWEENKDKNISCRRKQISSLCYMVWEENKDKDIKFSIISV